MELTKNQVLEKIRTQKPEYKNFSDKTLLEAAKKQFPDLKIKEEKGYFKELGEKVSKGAGNLLTDGINIVGGGISRNLLGIDRENVKLFDYQKNDPNFKGGFTQRTFNNFGEAWDISKKGYDARIKKLDEKGEGGSEFQKMIDGNIEGARTVFDFAGNFFKAGTDSIGDIVMSAGDTLIQDETQEEIKKYVSEQVQESETLTGIVDWFKEYQETLEYMKKNAPEDYATHRASIGFMEGFIDLLTAKIGSTAGKGIKNGFNSSLDISKNVLNKAKNTIEKLNPLKEKYFGKTDDIIENLDNFRPKENFFTKIEEKIAGIDEQTKNILKNTSEEDFDNYLNYAKNAVDDVRNPTPLEVAGDEAGDVLKILGDLKSQAGKSKSEALKMVENMEIDTKPIFDDFVNFLEKSNLTIDPEGKIKNIAGKVASVGDDSIRDIQNLSDEMLEIFTREKIDLGSLDALVDRVQDGINFKALNRPGATPSKTEKQISGFLGKSLNDRLKSVAGEDFVKYNEEFRKFLNLETKLSKLLGEDGNRGGSLMKAVFSPTDRGVKKLFTEIQKETGVDLISKAGLAKFAMQAVGDARQASLLEALDLGTGFTGKLQNKLKNIPIVGNFVDLAEDGAKKVFSPEKIGKKIVHKARTNLDEAKHYTNVDSAIYKNISEVEAEKIVKKYFSDEVGVEFLENIKTPEGLEALGKYKDKLISFAKNPKENVIEHEAFHAYFDLALKKSEKVNILNQIKSEKNFKNLLDAEEFLADSFADFVIGRKNVTGISENLKKIIGDLAFKFKQFFGKEDKVEALFRDLENIGKGKKKFEIKGDKNFGDYGKFLLDENGKNIDINSELTSLSDLRKFEQKNKEYEEKIRKVFMNDVENFKNTKANTEMFKTERMGKITASELYVDTEGAAIINNFLRGNDLYDYGIFENKKNLERAINALDESFGEIDRDIRLVRGIGGDYGKKIIKDINTEKLKIGSIISDKGFISTTNSADIGGNFSDWNNGMHMIIDVKKGEKILPMLGNDDEVEYLLKRNQEMIIKDIGIDKDGKTFIHLRLNNIEKNNFKNDISKNSTDLIDKSKIKNTSNKIKELEEEFEYWDDEYRLLGYGELPVEKSGLSLTRYKEIENYYNKYKKLLEEAKNQEYIMEKQPRYLLAGEKAQNSPKSNLDLAKQIETEGKTEDVSREKQWISKNSGSSWSIENNVKRIGKNEYGPIWEGLKGVDAEDFMIKKQKGEIKNAFHYINEREGIDIDIDLIWGGYNSEKGNGLGYSKIIEKHPEVIGRIQDLLDNLPLTSIDNESIVLGNEYSVAVIKLDYLGEKKNWIMTAYDRN